MLVGKVLYNERVVQKNMRIFVRENYIVNDRCTRDLGFHNPVAISDNAIESAHLSRTLAGAGGIITSGA